MALRYPHPSFRHRGLTVTRRVRTGAVRGEAAAQEDGFPIRAESGDRSGTPCLLMERPVREGVPGLGEAASRRCPGGMVGPRPYFRRKEQVNAKSVVSGGGGGGTDGSGGLVAP
ncbi:hypothetical protein GCM10010392_33870 [Streptomyces clavifer]|nr:hypothetical protein GCM10010392_33870 [Streptomyces clavifer]